jgi:hypothetical protein
MVLCVTMLHADIVDAALDILADYTPGLDQYIPLRRTINRLSPEHPYQENLINAVNSMIVVHVSGLSFQDAAGQDSSKRFPLDLGMMDRCDKLNPSVVLTALCMHAWVLSVRETHPYLIAWTRFVELIETYEEEGRK